MRTDRIFAATIAVVMIPIAARELGGCTSGGAAKTSDTSGEDASATSDAGDAAPPSNAEGGVAKTDAGDSGGTSSDVVVLSFAIMGGCRLDGSDLDPKNNPSSANVAELTQTLSDIAALPVIPKYFFQTGDLVDGLGDGAEPLTTQLAAWADLWTAGPLATKLTFIPMGGNHEMLQKATKKKLKKLDLELPNATSNTVYSTWISTHGFATHAGNGPTNAAPNTDALADDQSKLSYSFDDGAAHFIVLNTDTTTTTPDDTTGSTQIGWVPLAWLTADVMAAQANPKTTAIYVFGHKPLLAPSGLTDSTSAINPAIAPRMMMLFDASPKVRGYFTSHAHEWSMTKLTGPRGVMQLVAGNGGSSLDSSWTEPNPYFGFTVMRIYMSGKLGIVNYKRPAPKPYNSATTTAAIAAPEIMLPP